MKDSSIFLQKPKTPLFPDILWNRPINKSGAGKLLIVGGNKFKFFAPAQALSVAESIGAGYVKVLMPDVTKKIVGAGEHNEFAPSNPSGSFSNSGLDILLSLSGWSDGVLLAGDAGHNSETALLIEKFLSTFSGHITITHDFLDMFVGNPRPLLERNETLIVASFSQLQKLIAKSEYPEIFTYSMPTNKCLTQLQELTSYYDAHIITLHQQQLLAAVGGRVVHSPCKKEVWRIEQATKSAVFIMQQPDTPFESICTSLLDADIINTVD